LRNGPQILLRFHDFFTLEGMFVVPRPETSWLFFHVSKTFSLLAKLSSRRREKVYFCSNECS